MLQRASQGALPYTCTWSFIPVIQLSPDQFNIIEREGQDLSWLIKESIYIRVNNPTLNRNIDKFKS